jgi:hypothetical protein
MSVRSNFILSTYIGLLIIPVSFFCALQTLYQLLFATRARQAQLLEPSLEVLNGQRF